MNPSADEGSRESLNRITGTAIDAAYRIHSGLGPGCLESVYERLLARSLVREGFCVERQKPVSFEFDGLWFENAFRADLVVEKSVVIEVKAVVRLPPVFGRQMMTYLKLLDLRVGLILNFGAPLMKDGIHRIVNDF